MVVSGILFIFAPKSTKPYLPMRFVRLVIITIMQISALVVFADKTAEIRNLIPRQKGADLLQSYKNLIVLSRDSNDLSYQLRCINDLLRETQRQGVLNEEDDAWVEKMTFFYNNELDDSLSAELPPTLELLKAHKSWKNYYEVWTMLVNLHNFSGDSNTGLKEVNDMYHDAKERQNRYGMGMAYYAMGNVYSNMYNPEEALSSYQKSVDILMELDSLPLQLSDVFSYYTEELVRVEDFQTLERVTVQWEKFLTTYYVYWASPI